MFKFLVVLLLVHHHVQCQKLSTFGKIKPNDPAAPTTTAAKEIIKAKECQSHQDCAGIENTSCVRDPQDQRLRCLCGDNKAPVNGLCKSKLKGLRHLCEILENCEDGMVCVAENATKPAPFGAKVTANSNKVCLCDEESGWEEDPRGHHCSKAATNMVSGVTTTFASLMIGYFLARKQMQ